MAGRGRCLVARRQLRRGATAMPFTSPLCAVARDACWSRLCAACLRRRDVRSCGGCKSVKYCSSQCQKSDWAVHSKECEAMASCRAQVLGASPALACCRAAVLLLLLLLLLMSWSRVSLVPLCVHCVLSRLPGSTIDSDSSAAGKVRLSCVLRGILACRLK